MSLFGEDPAEQEVPRAHAPLAHRMRPRNLDEFEGQQHFVGPGKLLWRMLHADRLASVIFYGPPGTGKTALARIIASMSQARFDELNAASANAADIKAALKRAETSQDRGQRSLLFLDEIHRFNKLQQDLLLPAVEDGTVILVGATTQNPFFTINAALVSRSQVFEFSPLNTEEILVLLRRALKDVERGLGQMDILADSNALEHFAAISDGDARRALNALDIAALTTQADEDGVVRIDLAAAEDSIQKKAVRYDRDGDTHYDVASALIKSMRGSDPDAGLYWLARMLEAGEDPRFIARRIVICAAEDVGNAAPYALAIANAALQVAEFVGMPEARIPLAQAVIYIATCPKSNSAIVGIDRALKAVREGRTLEVPSHLRDASYPGAKRLKRGEGYQYSHNHEGHFVPQEYLPEEMSFYQPSDQGHEKEIGARLAEWKRRKEQEKK